MSLVGFSLGMDCPVCGRGRVAHINRGARTFTCNYALADVDKYKFRVHSEKELYAGRRHPVFSMFRSTRPTEPKPELIHPTHNEHGEICP